MAVLAPRVGSLATALVCGLLLCACQSVHRGAQPLDWITVSAENQHFILVSSGRRFIPWGFNYDHDHKMRLIEEYWDAEWPTVVEDFREMKDLGANVVRVHLQFAKFMDAADQPNERSLKQLARLLKLAEQTGLYLDLTGLGCYRKADAPRWYDEMNEADRWRAQARFWEAVAETCKDSPAVFCYDLMNEPFVPVRPRDPGDWLTGHLGDFHFVQALTLDPAGRTPPQVAEQWAAQLTAAIRRHDRRHLITVGLLPISGPDVVKAIAPHLDFIAVHEYPKSGELEKSLERLKVFNVGKPLLIEEMFPLACTAEELGQFIQRSSPPASGWMGFYWGQTPEQLRQAGGIAEAMVLGWLKRFQELNPNRQVEGRQ